MAPRSVDLRSSFAPSLDGMCEVLLVRHGEQRYVQDMVIGDAIDPPLSELGQQQAAAIGERLSSATIHAVYSSTMERARDTGQAIASHHGLDLVQRKELEEIDLWSGVPQDKALVDSIGKDRVVEIMRAANRTRRWDAYPYGEGADAFRNRIIPAIDQIIADHVGERVVVACHGGVICTYVSHIVNSPQDNLCSVHHTSITTVRGAGDQRALIALNDFAHVLAFQAEINPLNAT